MLDNTGTAFGTTTLKRIWGYIGGENALRESTLDILAEGQPPSLYETGKKGGITKIAVKEKAYSN